MREIKFRAWDTTSKKMYFKEDINEYSLEQLDRLSKTDDDYTKFMQFTGLLDKAGVEIYEGDILRLSNETNKLHYYQVKYVENLFILDGELAIHTKSAYFKEREVIGNIYENKELLENN